MNRYILPLFIVSFGKCGVQIDVTFNINFGRDVGIVILFLYYYFQKKKPDWALGAKEGEAGIRSTSEGPTGEAELEV